MDKYDIIVIVLAIAVIAIAYKFFPESYLGCFLHYIKSKVTGK
jgi:hypothetical protein